ncbi:MAG: M15 family metallopeptidase [Clostridiales bacterium]|nr:M15 family metallopeptidase [Clostridiales bacterium]
MYIKKEIHKRQRKRKQQRMIALIVVLAGLAAITAGFLKLVVFRGTDPKPSEDIYVMATDYPTYVPEQSPTELPTEIPTAAPTEQVITKRGSAQPIPENVRELMSGSSMTPNYNITYDDLSYLTIPHYDFSYNVTEGHMVVDADLAQEVLDIFEELFDIQYPIQRMELVDNYGADDYMSIENNNTSSFNYRESTDGSGRLSKHALGRAIDINPQINPYVNADGTGAHSNAAEYWSRDVSNWTSDIAKAAYIGYDTEIYRIFVNEHGWSWGGAWDSYRDYQHFQK